MACPQCLPAAETRHHSRTGRFRVRGWSAAGRARPAHDTRFRDAGRIHACARSVSRFRGALSPVLYGSDDEVARLGLNADVSILGRLDEAAMLQAYRDAAVVTLASVLETAPMSLAEALAAGRPVVATRVGGVEWVVADQVTGVLVESGDNEGLAEQLTRLLTDSQWRSALAAAARTRAHQ